MSILLFLFLACTGPSNPTEPSAEAAPGDPSSEQAELKAEGDACLAAAECSSGICEGQGCGDDAPGICVASDRICTMDAVTYCSCDNEDFTSSGSCPGRRFKSRTLCDPATELPTELVPPDVPPDSSSDQPPASPPGSETGPRGEGMSCLSHGECASGVCEGEGCGPDAPGTCQPAQRSCTRDIKMYCGCDGKSFRGSSSCPGGRYSAKGACEGDPGAGPALGGLPKR